jgi:hypothetical protein
MKAPFVCAAAIAATSVVPAADAVEEITVVAPRSDSLGPDDAATTSVECSYLEVIQ